MRLRKRLIEIAQVVSILAWMGGASAGILLTRDRPGEWKEMFVYSFIIPILVASFLYGQTGGLLVALVSSLVSGSLVVGRPEILESPVVQRVMFQILLFNVVALVTSGLSEREREAQTRYRSLFDGVPVGLYRSTPAGQFLDANPTFVQILGYPDREALLKVNAVDLYVDPADRARWQAMVEREGIVRDFEMEVRRRDGTVMWGRDSGRVVRNDVGEVLYYEGSLEDITRRKQAEIEREQLHQETRRLYETQRRQAEDLAAVNAVIRVMGSGLELDTLLRAITRELGRLVAFDRASVALGSEDRRTFTIVALENSSLPLLTRGMTLRVEDSAASQDVLEGKTHVTDDLSTEVGFLGERLLYQAGLRSRANVPLVQAGQVIGSLNVASLRPAAFGQREIALLEQISGPLAIALENARLYMEAQERARELAAALTRLEEMDRLKSEFVQNMSHELRTPLSIIMGYAEMLDSGELGMLSPNQQEPVSIIVRRARMLRRMVDDLMAILEVETQGVNREPVDLAELMRVVLLDFQVSAGKAGLGVSAEIATDLPAVSGDPARLRQVLDNLLGNALKFTPAGGSVTVCLHREGMNVVLEVTDTGIGIPPDKLEHIFGRFYQVDGSMKRRYGGVGLGLALVKEIVEAHGGQVSVRSVLGQGSSFRVSLPT